MYNPEEKAVVSPLQGNLILHDRSNCFLYRVFCLEYLPAGTSSQPPQSKA